MQGNYSVQIEDFAERHFIKSFQKKYQINWNITLTALCAQFERIDNLLVTNRAETIREKDTVKIIKTKFKVAGTQESAKTSGNRCIVAWDMKDRSVSVLLVYSKTDIPAKNETAEWQKIIKGNYPKYKHFF